MKHLLLTLTALTYAGAVLLTSCKKDDNLPSAAARDQALFAEGTAAGYTFYRAADTVTAAPPSPHLRFRLRFNAIAQAALDSTGALPAGRTFPTGSIVVKEVFLGHTPLKVNVMKKDPTAPDAALGWRWAEYQPGGGVIFSVADKGTRCTTCHGESPNRDFVRTFDLH